MSVIAMILSGLVEGAVIGTVVAAVMSKLLIAPRLKQGLKLSDDELKLCAYMVPAGIVVAAILDTTGVAFSFGRWAMAFPGLMLGVFVGLFSMAIAEFVMVIPSVSRVFKGSLSYFTLAVVFGRAAGALLYYLDPRWKL